ncbi:MAG TPA: hypothetical protein VIZ68_07135, partial [Thermoplasmata archaeon]
MPRRSLLSPALVALALVVVMVASAMVPRGSAPIASAPRLTSEPAGSGGAPTPAAAPEQPIGGRLFTTSTAPPSGASNSVTGLAVDPATGMVFATNEVAGTVTEFDETTGVLVDEAVVATFAAGSFPDGLALDALHHRLFVSVSTGFAGLRAGGWLLVLNETGLGVLANLSLASAPFPPFEPTFLAYDAATDQVFVENQSYGYLAVINLTTLAPPLYLTCPVFNCAYHGYGLLNVPRYHTLVIPTCAQQLWFVNTSNDSTRATVSGPSNSLMAWAAYDSATDVLWVENYTFAGVTGSFYRMNLTTLAIETDVPGAPPRGTDLEYDAVDDLLIATNLNGSEEISTYYASNASHVASHSAATGGTHPFLTLIADPSTHLAIASGPGNGTTIAFHLPSLTVAVVYPSFPAGQPATAVDPARADYFIGGISPTTIRAAAESDGAIRWTAVLPGSSEPVALAVAPVAGNLLVADRGWNSVRVLNDSTGAETANASLPGGASPCSLLFDAGSGRLYVGTTAPAEVFELDPISGAAIHALPIAGAAPCALALNPINGDLLVLSTGTPGELLDLDPGSFSVGATWTVG